MKKIIFFLGIVTAIGFISCRKCKTCQCWKDGVLYEEKNCAYGGGSSNQSLETWEKSLTESDIYDYDSAKCVTE